MEILGALAYLRNKSSSPLGVGKGTLGTADKLTTSLPLKLSHLVKHSGSQQSDQKKKKSTTTKSVERVLIRRKKEVKSVEGRLEREVTVIRMSIIHAGSDQNTFRERRSGVQEIEDLKRKVVTADSRDNLGEIKMTAT